MYVDLPLDVARLYIAHGAFWTDFIVAVSTPLQVMLLTNTTCIFTLKYKLLHVIAAAFCCTSKSTICFGAS